MYLYIYSISISCQLHLQFPSHAAMPLNCNTSFALAKGIENKVCKRAPVNVKGKSPRHLYTG